MNMFCTGVYIYEYVLYRRVYLKICFVQACIPMNMFVQACIPMNMFVQACIPMNMFCTGVYTYEWPIVVLAMCGKYVSQVRL